MSLKENGPQAQAAQDFLTVPANRVAPFLKLPALNGGIDRAT